VTSLRALGPATNRLLVGAVAGEFLTLLGFVYLGPMQKLLGHQPLTPLQWLPVLAAPMLLFAAEETRKAVVRRRGSAGGWPDRPGRIGPSDPETSERHPLALAADEDTRPDEVRRDERQIDLPPLGGQRRRR